MEDSANSLKEPLIRNSDSIQTRDADFSSGQDSFRHDFSELVSHFSSFSPNFISTPFKGTSLQISRDSKNFVFGSKEGRLAVCNIENKQLTLDKDLEEGSIWNIDITTDNKSVYTGGQGGKIKKFSLSNLDHEETLEGHTDEVNAVMITKDDKWLYSASDDRTVRRWNLSTKVSLVLYAHDSIVYCLDLSHDDIHVASGSRDGSVIVYNNIDDAIVCHEKVPNALIWCVRISQRNRFLIAGDDRPLISVWDFGNWNLLRVLSGHTDRVRCLEIDPLEKFLVSGGIDSMVKVWDLEHSRDEVTVYGHTDWVRGIIISSDRKFIHTLGDDCRIMTSKIPEFTSQVSISTNLCISSFLYNSREKWHYAISNNDVYLMKTPEKLEHLKSFDRKIISAHVTLNGTKLAVFLAQEKSTETEVVLIDLFGARSSKSVFLKTSSIIQSCLASEDGNYLITGEAYRVSIWNLETGSNKHIFRSHTSEVTALALDSTHLFAGDKNGIIKYYHIHEEFNEITYFAEATETQINLIKLKPDHKVFFSATSSNKIHVWSIENKTIIVEIEISDFAKQIYFTKNGLHCFFNYNNHLEVWNLENFSKCNSMTFTKETSDFVFIDNENKILLGFEGHYRILENPLTTSKVALYGNSAESHKFIAYLLKIFKGEVPSFDESMNEWLIEPFHINILHVYAYFNMNKHLSKAIKTGGSFFPSRSGYTPLSISIDKKLSECIDAIFETVKVKSEKNPLGFFYFSKSLPALNKSSYPKLHQLYNLSFSKSFSSNMPKFCDDSADLPIIKEVPELFITKDKFMDVDKYKSEIVAIEFMQSYVTFNTVLGSSESLEFMKSLLECKNFEVYSTSLIKIILHEKWKTIRWIFISETVLYLIYLGFLCQYAVASGENQNNYTLIVPFVISNILFLNEIVQMFESRLLYFKSFWNYVDLSRFLVFFFYCILEYLDAHENTQENFIISAVVLSLLRGLSYFRIHSTTRWVVNLIFDVFYQLWALILVATYSIVASGVIYRTLFDVNYGQDLSDEDANYKLQWLLFFFVLIINPIIILNLFISIVGDAFEKSQDEKTVKDGQELAEMIFEGELLFFCNRKKNQARFVHVVREEYFEIQAQNTAGQRIKKINENVMALNRVANRNKNEISDLKNFVENKIEEIQRKTETILETVKNKQ